MEWISRLEKLGASVNIEDLESKEALGEILPYERDIIPQYDRVAARIAQLLENPRDLTGEGLFEGGHSA